MTSADIDEKFYPLKDFICKTLLDGRNVQADENLLLSGLLDSLGVMSLVAFVEKQYAIEIPFEDVIIENFATLDAIENYIRASESQDG